MQHSTVSVGKMYRKVITNNIEVGIKDPFRKANDFFFFTNLLEPFLK